MQEKKKPNGALTGTMGVALALEKNYKVCLVVAEEERRKPKPIFAVPQERHIQAREEHSIDSESEGDF